MIEPPIPNVIENIPIPTPIINSKALLRDFVCASSS